VRVEKEAIHRYANLRFGAQEQQAVAGFHDLEAVSIRELVPRRPHAGVELEGRKAQS
jgi:hypothetical protein